MAIQHIQDNSYKFILFTSKMWHFIVPVLKENVVVMAHIYIIRLLNVLIIHSGQLQI